jgi:hypothetical protein
VYRELFHDSKNGEQIATFAKNVGKISTWQKFYSIVHYRYSSRRSRKPFRLTISRSGSAMPMTCFVRNVIPNCFMIPKMDNKYPVLQRMWVKYLRGRNSTVLFITVVDGVGNLLG